VYHQGTRWQASGPTVPLLIAMVDDPTTPDRSGILDLLTAVAIGDRSDDELPFDPDAVFAAGATISEDGMARLIRRLYDEQDPLDDDEGLALSEAAVARWEADAYRPVADRVDTIAAWVDDADVEVAARAAALAWFPPTRRSVSALLSVPAGQPDAPVRASANLTLAHLPITDRRVNEHLRRLLIPPDGLVAVTAGIVLAYRMGDAIPDQALSVLVGCHKPRPAYRRHRLGPRLTRLRRPRPAPPRPHLTKTTPPETPLIRFCRKSQVARRPSTGLPDFADVRGVCQRFMEDRAHRRGMDRGCASTGCWT